MLELVDLSAELGKKQYRAAIGPLERRLGELQRRARELAIPVVVVFEGWDASGKGTLINRLALALDPRGYTVHLTKSPTEEEALRPFFWRFWNRLPARGRIALFDRSWYRGVLVERVEKTVRRAVWERRYHDINVFERQLADDGTVIVKFFLHISRKEQARRFRKLEKNPATAWKVADDDRRQHRRYGRYADAAEEMFRATGRVPWTIVEAHDRRFATVKVFGTVVAALERAVKARAGGRPGVDGVSPAAVLAGKHGAVLATVDLGKTLARPRYERELEKLQERLWELQHEAYVRRLPVVVVYEGWDAAGKGGNIRRLVQGLDPRGYEVVPVSAPNEVEKGHHYLWRFWTRFPKAGHFTIFDRSWYGRVLVERVEGFCTEQEWRRAYAEINEMEEQWTAFGTVLVKFWLHIDRDEQLRRFRERERLSHKRWKITAEDWRNRRKWDRYLHATDEMLFRTSTSHAPWTVVEANCKLHARIKALRTVVERVEEGLGE